MPSLPDAIILCGGAGTRLRGITGSAPKGMADVAGHPFLELLFRQLRRHGFERVILAVGYHKEAIRGYFGERAAGLNLAYSAESCPLGTGGALRNAADLVESEDVLIMNGDSYTEVDLRAILADYRESRADVSLVVVPADGRDDSGCVLADGASKVMSFEEKRGAFHAPYLNAGIYMMSRQMLYEIPPGLEVSLEYEIFPRWLRQGKHLKGFVCIGRCIDIGTPERYREAQDILANAEAQATTPKCETR